MRPRHLYTATFAWLVLSGGRFTAPFLEEVARFDDTLTGIALALQFGLTSQLGTVGGWIADRLEARSPHRGRCVVIAAGMTVSTAAFMMHGVVGRVLESGTPAFVCAHMFLRAVFSVGMASIMPVLDGLTLAFLEEEGADRADYGKERVYGVYGWGVASVVLGPFIDRVGFDVMFCFAPIALLWNLITIAVFSRESERRKSTPKLTGEMTPLQPTETQNEEIYRALATLETETKVESNTREPTLLSLLGTLFGSVYAMVFILSFITLGMGMSVVESLIFLFFRELGASNTVCGMTVVVTVLFEIPIFQLAPQLLRRFGVGGMQQVACLAYITRVVGYTFIPPHRVLMVLFLEPLHGVTVAFAQTAGVEFVADMAPKGYDASCQGLLASLKGLGSVVGLSLGGWAEDELGAKAMYRLYAGVVTCGLVVLAFATLHRQQVSAKRIRDVDSEELNQDRSTLTSRGDWDASAAAVVEC